jgi:hypothetical protein
MRLATRPPDSSEKRLKVRSAPTLMETAPTISPNAVRLPSVGRRRITVVIPSSTSSPTSG